MPEPFDMFGGSGGDESGDTGYGSLGVPELAGNQLANAKLIIQTGTSMGMSPREIRVALAVAMQESSLTNLDTGDRDSAGLFQQRPSMGWGTYEQVTDPTYATRTFYNALKGVSGRDDMAAWQMGQAVQRSADGRLYKRWHDLATSLWGDYGGGATGPTGGADGGTFGPESLGIDFSGLNEVLGGLGQTTSEIKSLSEQLEENAQTAATGSSPTPIGVEAADAPMEFSDLATGQMGDLETMETLQELQEQLKNLPDVGEGKGKGGLNLEDLFGKGPTPSNGKVGKVIDLARSFLGDPYVWGGSAPGGFDCSGLMQYIFAKAGVNLPRTAAEQGNLGTHRGLKNLEPGDMIFWDWGAEGHRAGADHVALYIGNGQIIEAPRPGENVQISNIYHADDAWSVRLF